MSTEIYMKGLSLNVQHQEDWWIFSEKTDWNKQQRKERVEKKLEEFQIQ